jgi:hypothetical protein
MERKTDYTFYPRIEKTCINLTLLHYKRIKTIKSIEYYQIVV